MIALAQNKQEPQEAQGLEQLAGLEQLVGLEQLAGEQESRIAAMVRLKRCMDSLANPHAAMNEYPNPPWNTVPYAWDTVYPVDSLEYRAQALAKYALATGLQYSIVEPSIPAPQAQKVVRPMQESTNPRAAIRIVNGVLTDTYLLVIREGKPVKLPVPEIGNVGDILQLCLTCDLQAIWVLAGSRVSGQATKAFIEAAPPSWKPQGVSYTKVPKEHTPMCKYARAYKTKEARTAQETGRACVIGFAEHTTKDRWGFDAIENPLILLAAIAYLEDALDMPVAFSPNNVGKRMMEQGNDKKRANWTRPVEIKHIKPIVDTGAFDCTWKRPLTQEELTGELLLVGYDKDAQYPASCTSVLLGEGNPRWVAMPHFDLKKLRPGVYHCTITGASPFDGVNLPHPTDGVTEGWFWTYTVKLLAELGYTVTIDEAWVWEHEQAHTILRPFAEDTWNARQALKTDRERYRNAQARELAYDASKEVANQSIGLLDHYPDNPDWPSAFDWYRPDWNALIKDNAKYQMFWRIRKYLALGYRPVGIQVDCLYYIVSDRNPVTALPGMMERAGKLGGYKVKYKHAQVFPVEQIAAWFADVNKDIAEINQLLLALDRELAQNREN